MLDLHTLKNIFVCAKHFDPDDIIDRQTYFYIDGQTKIRPIKATLKKGAVPKYFPGFPDRLNDHTIKYQRGDRDKKEHHLQIQVCQVVLNIQIHCL